MVGLTVEFLLQRLRQLGGSLQRWTGRCSWSRHHGEKTHEFRLSFSSLVPKKCNLSGAFGNVDDLEGTAIYAQGFLNKTEISKRNSHWSHLNCMRNPMKMSSILKPSALIRCEGLMPGDIGYGCTGETDVPPSWSSCPCHICPILKRLWSLSILSTFFNRFLHFHDHATWPVEVATRWHVVYFESFLQLPHGDENWWNTSEGQVCMKTCNILQHTANYCNRILMILRLGFCSLCGMKECHKSWHFNLRPPSILHPCPTK